MTVEAIKIVGIKKFLSSMKFLKSCWLPESFAYSKRSKTTSKLPYKHKKFFRFF